MFRPTERQRYEMMDCGMSMPMRLSQFDPHKTFVYDRTYGYYHVSPTRHVFAMAFLYDLHMGGDGTDWFEAACQRFPKSSSPVQLSADAYLDTIRGTCFGSSASKHITCGFEGSLSPSEVRTFGDIRYIR